MGAFRPSQAQAFDPAEFGELFVLALEAGQSRADMPGPKPERYGLEAPYVKAAAALRERIGDDELAYKSALARFVAVMDLYGRRALAPWMRPAPPERPERRALHPAVLDVAARMRLSRNGKFPVDKFLSEVARVARTEYPELADWSETRSA